MFNNIIGRVDGVMDGELYGWVANKHQPERVESIVCRDARGESLTLSAFTHRPDVSAVIGVPGVFGFAIPLDLLRRLEQGFRVTDRLGATLENGEEVFLPQTLATERPEAPLTIFLHIPKTAGTSLRHLLLQKVPSGKKMLLYPDTTPGISVQKFHQVPLVQRNQLAWIFGHCQFGLDRYVTQVAQYITFIREPKSRLRSNFAHHAAAGTEFEVERLPVRAATVINEGLSEEFDNNMTRVIAGVGLDKVPIGRVGDDEVALALRNVRRHFYFVGRHSRLDADSLTLQTLFGVPPEPPPRHNVTPATRCYDEAELAAVDWKHVFARNRADLLLYSLLEQEGLVSRVLQPGGHGRDDPPSAQGQPAS